MGLTVYESYSDPITAGYPMLALPLVLLGGGPALSWMGTEALRRLGTISFSIYLLHMPVIKIAERLPQRLLDVPGLGFAFILSITLGVSLAANRVIERPAQSAIRGAFAPRRQAT